jgi:hypothetical protein
MLGRRRRRTLDEKETLQAEFNCIRERAINNDEPTAIVLCEDHDQLTIDSFSVKEWLPQGGEEIVILAHEEARARAWRTWLIDIVVVGGTCRNGECLRDGMAGARSLSSKPGRSRCVTTTEDDGRVSSTT